MRVAHGAGAGEIGARARTSQENQMLITMMKKSERATTIHLFIRSFAAKRVIFLLAVVAARTHGLSTM